MKEFLVTIGILCFSLSGSIVYSQDFLQYRQNFKLEKWKFHKGEIHSADNCNSIDESHWSDITVPHTWNVQDVLTDGPEYYQGIGWYRTHFAVNRNSKENRFFLRFEGVSLVAEVYFNGNYLGTHKGSRIICQWGFHLEDSYEFQHT
jgi:beta-galactosidase/beta-glucuronidase